MIKHNYTESTEINFSKLEERIMEINDPTLGKYEDIREMLYELTIQNNPTLIMATGGSKVVAYYLQMIIERIRPIGIICEVIEPRDYFYKRNIEMFSNLIVISASGDTNGISEALARFKGKKYLICEKEKDKDCEVITWGNELYDREKSFISLATSLGPISLLLDATTSLNLKLESNEIIKINDMIKKLLFMSVKRIDKLTVNFKDTSLVQIMSGYETKTSSSVLESNLTEVGLSSVVVHDKGSYCHGRSNLLFQYPESQVVYLTHDSKELDRMLINLINKEYSNLSLFNTDDLDENIFWKEYYLILQMYFFSKKIADDKNIDLTMPEYNLQLVKKMYNYKGEM